MRIKRGVLKTTLVVVSLALMSSLGGLFVLALALLPFHWLAARSASKWGRFIWIGLAAGIVAENVWAGYYVLFGEDPPLVWLTPALAFAVTGVAFFRLSRRATAPLTV